MRASYNRGIKKGMASIIGAMIFFSVIFSVLYTYDNVVQDTNQKVNDSVVARVSKDLAQQNEDFKVRTRNVTQNSVDWIGYAVDNEGQEIINVVLAFVHEPSGDIADQDDGLKAVFSGSPVFSVGSGAVSGVVNTTVAYGGGNYTVVVVTDKGNVRSAVFPAKLMLTVMGPNSTFDSYVFHIMEDQPVGDPLEYDPDYGIALNADSTTTLYFGADEAGGDVLSLLPEFGLYWTVFVIFAYEDVNDNGTYEPAIDNVGYAQALPFQAGLAAL